MQKVPDGVRDAAGTEIPPGQAECPGARQDGVDARVAPSGTLEPGNLPMEIGVGQVGELVLPFVWRPGLWLAIRHVAMMTDGCRHSAHGAGQVADPVLSASSGARWCAASTWRRTLVCPGGRNRGRWRASFGAVYGDYGGSDRHMAPTLGVAPAFHVEHPQPWGADQPRTACGGGRSRIADECKARPPFPGEPNRLPTGRRSDPVPRRAVGQERPELEGRIVWAVA